MKVQSIQQKIFTSESWLKEAASFDPNEKVVFTNGCFDILHVGHVDYLEKASQLGTKLVVGLNSDESISRIKGINRPICPEESRKKVLAALGFIDAVIVFNEETPLELITKIKPMVLVKGSDYKVEQIVGSSEVLSWGGEVKTIDLVEGFSTTSIINKIKQTV